MGEKRKLSALVLSQQYLINSLDERLEESNVKHQRILNSLLQFSPAWANDCVACGRFFHIQDMSCCYNSKCNNWVCEDCYDICSECFCCPDCCKATGCTPYICSECKEKSLQNDYKEENSGLSSDAD